jgi:putative ABC transport system ATP-binding protein
LNNVIIKLSDVSKNYIVGEKITTVIHNISFDICSGEFVSIMGPSGSGKSTLLYLIGALEQVSSGSIKIKGEELVGQSDAFLSKLRINQIGFIFQSYNLVPNLNIQQNILLPLLFKEKHNIGEQYIKKAYELTERLGISDKFHCFPYQLSGGQQQRVAIARALINEPDIILADEPTGNLDSKTGEEILNLFKELNEEGKTIIHVTHSLDAANYGTKIIHLKDGKII